MHAIILDRNKQYFVKPGILLKVDLLKIAVGELLVFNKLLLFYNTYDDILFGNPFISNKSVVSKVLSHIKGDKKIILKFKRRKHYMKKQGHRQKYTLLKIVSFENK